MRASSSMVAREHGHCGCAKTIKVDRCFAGGNGTAAGHRSGGIAGRPGVLAYLSRVWIPKPKAGIHTAISAPTANCRLKLPGHLAKITPSEEMRRPMMKTVLSEY